MPDLYVVNTSIHPGFLNPRSMKPAIRPEQAETEHGVFISKVRESYPGFDIPYFAFFDDGTYFVPMSGLLRGGRVGNWRNSLNAADLAHEINRYAIGNGTIRKDEVIPITAVVEFSPEELFPGAISEIGRLHGYKIKRIHVE